MIAGRYTLEREVGRGGMGAVWLGRDEVLGRAVALKQVGMAPGGTQADLTRAAREARLAARLNHPHVVAVFDLVSDGDDPDRPGTAGRQWLVMEYVESLTLAQMVREQGPLTPERAAALLVQAADALAAAHAAGIVHRDVKPSNILVTADGQVKLSDFGIARAEADVTLTQTGLVTGSPAYLAPEVASGRTATDASDVWSLGATLYHALAGHPPYEVGDNVLGALYRIVHEDPPRLPEAGRLAPLLEATMAKDPEARWPMARVRDVLAAGAVGSQGAGGPVGAVPVGGPPGLADDPARTEVMPATAPAPRRVAAPASADPAAGPAGAGSRDGGSRSSRALPALLAVLALVAAAVVVGWLALGGNDDAPAAGDGPGTGSSGRTGSSGASDDPTPSQDPGPTAAGMREFIGTYLSTVTRDPAAAYEMLTPEFQQASGGLSGYRGFWGTIRSAELTSVTSTDPGTGTISYRVDYTRKNGSTTSDQVTLQLVHRDGEYLIAGEA